MSNCDTLCSLVVLVVLIVFFVLSIIGTGGTDWFTVQFFAVCFFTPSYAIAYGGQWVCRRSCCRQRNENATENESSTTPEPNPRSDEVLIRRCIVWVVIAWVAVFIPFGALLWIGLGLYHGSVAQSRCQRRRQQAARDVEEEEPILVTRTELQEVRTAEKNDDSANEEGGEEKEFNSPLKDK